MFLVLYCWLPRSSIDKRKGHGQDGGNYGFHDSDDDYSKAACYFACKSIFISFFLKNLSQWRVNNSRV